MIDQETLRHHNDSLAAFQELSALRTSKSRIAPIVVGLAVLLIAVLTLVLEVNRRARDAKSFFLEFEQLDNSRSRRGEGTGVGLQLSKALVEMMGGRLTLTSREGIGTTFRMRLPMAANPRPSAPRTPRPKPRWQSAYGSPRLTLRLIKSIPSLSIPTRASS
jgi:Histidine kinase-, DNA gyrase B-, and HSP90-like ATPase